jgi:hypothetical protein
MYKTSFKVYSSAPNEMCLVDIVSIQGVEIKELMIKSKESNINCLLRHVTTLHQGVRIKVKYRTHKKENEFHMLLKSI